MATRKNNPPANRLAEIVAYRRSQGGSITGSIAGGLKERLKEKFDPRQLINQKGLLAALFPGLNAYQSKTAASEISNSSMQSASFDEIKPILETISYNTKMTAKNTMVLPSLHRDVNVIRQNMVKLVKLKGGDARTKADMYFVNAKEREEKYERELKKNRNNQSKLLKLKDDNDQKKGKGFLGFLGKLFSTIINGFKSIVGAISNLGKAIFGAFKLLAEIVIDVIGKAIGLILSPLKLLGGLIKDFFVDFFKNSFIRILATTLIRSAIAGVFSLLFGKKALIRLAGFLVGIFAQTYGIDAFVSYLKRSNLAEKPLDIDDSKDDFMKSIKRFEDLSKTTSEKKSFLPYEYSDKDIEKLKESGAVENYASKEYFKGGRSSSLKYNPNYFNVEESYNEFTDRFGTIHRTGERNEPMFKKSYEEKAKNGELGIYSIPLPGFDRPITLLLNKNEANNFGKNIKTYSFITDRLKSELQLPLEKRNRALMESLVNQMNEIKLGLSKDAFDLFNQQYNTKYKDYNVYKEGLDLARNQTGSKDLLSILGQESLNLIDLGVDKFMQSDAAKQLQDLTTNEISKQYESFKEKLNLNQLRQQGLDLFDESRKKTLQTIEDFTSANKNLVGETKSRVIEIVNNNSNNEGTTSSDEEVAPAWNQDYFENLGDTSIIGIK
jgi:hypothetical protein